MTEQTKIEWADSTFNPWTGCTQISPACDHCYAKAWSNRAGSNVGKWGPGAPRVRTSAAYWKQPAKWNRETWEECTDCGWRGPKHATHNFCPACDGEDMKPTRRRVFCASLADWLDNEVPIEWLVDLLDLIRLTPNLDWLLLTKRIGNWRSRILSAISAYAGISQELATWLGEWLDGNPPANVWIGATFCNQAEADRDIPKLLAVPARVRFLSIEPMLGPIDMARWLPAGKTVRRAGTGEPMWVAHFYMARCEACGWTGSSELLNYVSHGDDGQCYCPDCNQECDTETFGLDWIICGGESGPHARPMHPNWARTLRDQCQTAGVPFLFKQWGEWCPMGGEAGLKYAGPPLEPNRVHWVWPDGSHEQIGCGRVGTLTSRVGKKAAGRFLDGVEHNGFPQVRP